MPALKYPYFGTQPFQDWANSPFLKSARRDWHWFLVSPFLCALLGLLFLRYKTPYYNITASLLVSDDSRGSDFHETALLKELGFPDAASSVENEIETLKSRTLFRRVVEDLALTIQYFAIGHLKTAELYGKTPFKVTFLKARPAGTRVYYITRRGGSFTIRTSEGRFEGKFGLQMQLPHGLVTIDTTRFQPAADYQYSFTVSTTNAVIEHYRRLLTIQAPNKTASLVNLSIQDALPEKGEAILKHLIALYQEASIAEQNKVADNTIAFINSNLKRVAAGLSDVESGIEAFRRQNRFIDLGADSREALQTLHENEAKERELVIRLKVNHLLQKYLHDQPTTAVPPTLYQSETAFAKLAMDYNETQQQYTKALTMLSPQHPKAKSMYSEMETAKQHFADALKQHGNELAMSINAIRAYQQRYREDVARLPAQQRQFLSQSREQGIQQELYLFLLKKRMETAISRSANIANARVIDPPEAGMLPAYPNRQLTMLIALFSGILIPAGSLYIAQIFNNKVSSKEDIQQQCDIPILGEISQQSKQAALMTRDNRSLVREQFRSLRTNIQFAAGPRTNTVVLLTSAMADEGKSFVAAELARSFALTEKKVLLMDFDLRKPSLSARLNLLPHGITDTIKSHDEPLIQSSGNEYPFDFLAAGTVVSDADGIWLSPKVGDLIDAFRDRYDYILIDSPPIGLVTDARLLGRYADMTLYIVRQHFTFRHQITEISQHRNRESLPELFLVLNGTRDLHRYQYSYY